MPDEEIGVLRPTAGRRLGDLLDVPPSAAPGGKSVSMEAGTSDSFLNAWLADGHVDDVASSAGDPPVPRAKPPPARV
ncbi:hypothetical protein [Streptomyces kurssanovii]|uniref:Uncharacterized protein n=1 Tax=Streptomyces kurssanovii TaxID=67312 RepID=A0ABV3I070_9ACTN